MQLWRAWQATRRMLEPGTQDAQSSFMSKHQPTVRKFMTMCPLTIPEDMMLSKAQETMREKSIRHLPVMRDGKLVGLLGERDIALVEALEGVDPRAVPVRVAMNTNVYTAMPDTPLYDVIVGMADRKVGSCVVMLGGDVAGILTSVDVCRAFASLLKSRSTH